MTGRVTRRLVPVAASTLLAFAACERGDARPSVAPAPPGAAAVTPAAFVTAEAVGSDEDAAYAEAIRALARELLGDPRWLDVVPVEIHERPAELDAQTLPDGQVRVRLGLSHSDAAAVLTAFEAADPSVVAPALWRDTVYAYLKAHAREHACVRRQKLFTVACETGTTGDADTALRELIGAVSMVPVLRGGVPVGSDGMPLRPPGVFVFWHGAPIEDVPVVWSAKKTGTVFTDANGLAAGPPAEAKASVDAAALLGPAQAAWTVPPVAVRLRPLDPRRWAALLVDDRGRTLAGPVATAFERAMESAGFGTPKHVAKARVDDLEALATRSAGDVDVLVHLDVRSGFASRAGGGRVWFEANATVQAFNVWQPDAPLARFDVKATASGVGDTRADRAARARLAENVAKALADKLLR